MALKDKILERAQKFIEKGALDKAVIEYRAALDLDPRDISIRLRIGDLYVKLNKKSEAIKEYSEVARANSQRGFYLKAIAVYKQVLKLDESLDIHYKLAELYAKQRLIADAVSEYSHIVSSFEKRGKTSEVMELLKKMIEIDPENVGIRLKLAELYQRLSFEKDALEEYCWIFEKLLAQGKPEKAEKIFINLYNLNPREPRVLRGLASINKQKNDTNQYLRFSKALFYIYKDDGAAESARAVCEEILTVRPDEQEAVKFLRQFAKADDYAREKEEEERRKAEELMRAEAERKAEEARRASEEAERIAKEAAERAAQEALKKTEEAPLIDFPGEPAAEQTSAPEQEIEITLEGFDELETTSAEQISGEAEGERVEAGADDAGDEYVEVNIPGLEPLEPAFRSAAEEFTITIPEDLSIAPEEETEAEGIEGAIEEIEEEAGQEESPVEAAEEPPGEEALIEIPEELKEPEQSVQAPVEPQEPLIDIELPEQAAFEEQRKEEAKEEPVEEPLIEIEMPEAAEPAPEAPAEAAFVETPETTADTAAAPAGEAVTEAEAVAEEEKEPEFEIKERPSAEPVQEAEITAPLEMAERMEVHEVVVHREGEAHEKVSFEIKETYPVAPPVFEESKKAGEVIDISEIPELAEAVGKDEVEPAVPVEEAEEDLSDAISELMEKMGAEQSAEGGVEAAAPERQFVEVEEHRPEEMLEPEKISGEELKAEKKDEYVDLSAELGMEEALEDLAGKWEGKESKEAFDEFKSGIGQQLSKEDSETHYNLGIAYMEMELHSEASKEFKIALKDPRLEFDCYIRLGLCSMATHDPHEAIVYYLKGLKTEGASAQERKGMMYELALAYEAAGDMEEARQIFGSIHSTDPGYREVASKVSAVKVPEAIIEAAAERPLIPLDDGMIEVELL